MINFFRKKRKKLADDNKAFKYMRYAIGEIILVVVGILIALAINNWNNNRITKIEETKILKSLYAEINSNFELFNESHNFHLNRLNHALELITMDLSQRDFNYIDSVASKTHFTYTFNPSLGIYNNLINSGKIEIISNGSLKSNIAVFKDFIADYRYNEEVVGIHGREFYSNYWLNNDSFKIYPEVFLGLKPRTPDEEVRDKGIYIDFLSDDGVKKYYVMLIIYLKDIMNEAVTIKKKFNVLLKQLETEIKYLEK